MKSNNNQGYILLEIIVAVAILAGGLLVVVRSLTETTGVESALKNRSTALILLGEKAAELRLSALDGMRADASVVGESAGQFEDRAPGFSWSISVAENPELRGEWVVVKVLWKDGSKERSVETLTMLTPASPAAPVP